MAFVQFVTVVIPFSVEEVDLELNENKIVGTSVVRISIKSCVQKVQVCRNFP